MCHISNINALYIPAEARIWSCHSFSFSKSEYVKFFKLIGGKDSFKAFEAIFVRHLQIGLRETNYFNGAFGCNVKPVNVAQL